MEAKILYTFPLMAPVTKPPCTNIQRGANSFFGFGVKAPLASQGSQGNFSFFTIDAEAEVVVPQVISLPYGSVGNMQLCYDHMKEVWVVGIERAGHILELHEIIPDNLIQQSSLLSISDEHVGLGEKAFVAFWQNHQQYPLLFRVMDVGEVSDASLYWTQWRPTTDENSVVFQHIGYCDAVMPYVGDEVCLLFLCQRVFHETPVDAYLRHGHGDWHISIAVYNVAGKLLHYKLLPDITFAIQDWKLPETDLSTWLDVCIQVTQGPFYGPNQRPTCVAALLLNDTRLIQSKGGLYCFDMQGRIIQSDYSLLGSQISLCRCGEQIIGADEINGQWRLWRWNPVEQVAQKYHTNLPTEIQRVTVVAMEQEQDNLLSHFWCIEEYPRGLRISQRECMQLDEVNAVWLEGFSLLEKVPGSYGSQQRVYGMVAFRNKLMFVGIDTNKQLKLLQVQ